METKRTSGSDTTAAELVGLTFALLEDLKGHVVRFGEENGLSLPQCHALFALAPGAPEPMRNLADILRCDPSNVTGIIDRLEGLDLVERRQGIDDRRVREIALTEKGQRQRDRLVEKLSIDSALAKNLTKTQQQQLKELLLAALRSN